MGINGRPIVQRHFEKVIVYFYNNTVYLDWGFFCWHGERLTQIDRIRPT